MANLVATKSHKYLNTVNRPSIFCTVDSAAMYTVNSQKETFSNYYPVKINYKVSIFIYCGFCAKKLSTKSLLLAGQKLLYKESASVTFMQEKTKKPKTKQYSYKKGKM